MPLSKLPFQLFEPDSGLTDASPTDSSGLPASPALASDGWISFSSSGLVDAVDASWQPLGAAASSQLAAAAPTLSGAAITPPADNSGPIQSTLEHHAGIPGGDPSVGGNSGTPTPAGDTAESSFGLGKITFLQDEDVTPTVGPYSGPSGPDVPAFTGAGINVVQTTTNADGSTTEIVTFAGSGITFNNTFQSGLPQAYINDALAAEQLIASNWNGTVTINESFNAQAPGLTGWLASNSFYVYGVSYATLEGALGTLAAHEPGNTYLQQFVAHLPSADPSNGAGFELALPYARMLGLTTSAQNPDDIITLNTSYSWSYGQDVINTLVHEITEGGMGRIGGLGDQNSLWSVMDLFRYNSSGVADYTDGRDGRSTFFSYNGGTTLSSLSFNNEYGGSTKVNGGDTADFTQLDIFGTGSPGETNTLSQTDIQIMEALGWAPPITGPVVSASNTSLSTASVAASSLFSVSDPNGKSIIEYAFIDTGPGHFVLNGVTQPQNTEIDITATQLAQLTYQSAGGSVDTLQIRAEDSLAWGAWTSFNVTSPPGVIESFGSTDLVQVGNNLFLYAHGTTSGPELMFNGAPVTVAQFSGWAPIGAEVTASGYEVAWKQVGGQYAVWTTNSSGAYTGNAVGLVSGSSTALESLEPSFHQDLNGDGVIGLPPTVIEHSGSTDLVQVGNNYFLYAHGTTSGPELMFNGVPVTVGQFSGWTPIGVEVTASGYEVAWKVTGVDQYAVWTTNSSGNYNGNSVGLVSGSSIALESVEPSFQQDLNGDGVIGVPTTVIEHSGSTDLVQVGNNYFLYAHGTTSGPELMFNGAPVTVGQFSGWTPIGAEVTASGYEVAWKVTGVDQYSVWTTNSSGNYNGNSVAVVSGSNIALESVEPSFQQDLNGDGVIGLPTTVIEHSGSTDLVQVGNNYFLYAHGTTSGPELMFNNAPVTVGQFSGWAPIGAEVTAGGYEVAWKVTGVDQYAVWTTNSGGNYNGNLVGAVSGSNNALESVEPSFQQDLNGDGVIGVPSHASFQQSAIAAGDLSTAGPLLSIDANITPSFAALNTSAAQSVAAPVALSLGDTFDFSRVIAENQVVAPSAAVQTSGFAAPVSIAVSDSNHSTLMQPDGGASDTGHAAIAMQIVVQPSTPHSDFHLI